MTRIAGLTSRRKEVGRIRIGKKKGGNGAPERLSGFRLTSPYRDYIEEQAELYGGEVKAWDGGIGKQWELITSTPRLQVIVPQRVELDQVLEARKGARLVHKCDGIIDLMTMAPCTYGCSPTDGSVKALHEALDRRAQVGVKEVSRLSVQLPGKSGSGLWRFQSVGHFTAEEMLGAAEDMPYHTGQRAELVLGQKVSGSKTFPVVGMVFLEDAVDPRLAQYLLEAQAQAAVRAARLHAPSTLNVEDPFDLDTETDDEYDETDEVAETTETVNETTGEVTVFQHANTRQVQEMADLRAGLFYAKRNNPTQAEDEAWRTWLEAEFGVRSTAKMSYAQAEDALRILGQMAARKAGPTEAQTERYVEVMTLLSGTLTEAQANTVIKKEWGADTFAGLSEADAEKCLTRLEAKAATLKVAA